ncbi:dehydrogenase [Microbacterium mangrovi]|uniref:Dehydrogenase n=1 Tax=Microbacterium mangrovi TaxID=1348253 RepID=A0A0B1ZYM2_9MICO|nr:C-terminal binding protein [Microbacterium mangrovi]KHK95836.1 dehydrogenase [Microbacterium mangrovi]
MSTETALSTESPLAVYTDTDDIDPAPGIEILEQAGFRVVRLETRDADEIVAAAQDAEALLVGYAPITAELIARLPRLRIVALLSMGVDNVDVPAATDAGVWVANILGAATDEVAAHALGLALAARSVDRAAQGVRAGGWRFDEAPKVTTECTVGILGLGRIGRRFAEFAAPMFGEVLGSDPHLPDDEDTRRMLAEVGIRRVELDELLASSDVLSLHVPLTDDTARLVDAGFLAALPEGAVLVNVSRGGLIDEDALLAALDSGHLAGAGLDVLTTEPAAAGHPFRTHRRVVLTPHVAYLSTRTSRTYATMQAQNVVAWLTGGTPNTPVNRPVALVAD